jgi:DNA-binding PadR family transcriptional regulator
LGRYRYKDAPPSAKILPLIPVDGRPIALKKLRETAIERLKMSPPTINAALNSLEHMGSVSRNVDSSAHPPRIYYSRSAVGLSKKPTVTQWFEHRFGLVEAGLLIALQDIARNPRRQFEEIDAFKSVTEDGQQVSSIFELLVLRYPWNIVTEFQNFLASDQVTTVDRGAAIEIIEAMLRRLLSRYPMTSKGPHETASQLQRRIQDAIRTQRHRVSGEGAHRLAET